MEVLGSLYPASAEKPPNTGYDDGLYLAVSDKIPKKDVDEYQMAFHNAFSECLSFGKYDWKPLPTINHEAWNWARQMLLEDLMPACAGWDIMTTDQAISESVADSHAALLYDVCSSKPVKKGDVLCHGWIPDRLEIPLREDKGLFLYTTHVKLIQDMLKGLYPEHNPIWEDFTKVELLPFEKWFSRRFRIINAPPIDLYLAQIKFLGGFELKLKNYLFNSPELSSLCLNFSPFHGGILRIASSFPEGWIFTEDDASEYDSRLRAELAHMIKGIRLELACENALRYRDQIEYIYKCEIEGPILLKNGQLIKKFLGQPTGSFITSKDNTMKRKFMHYYAWHRLVGPQVNPRDYTKTYFLGDDLLGATHPLWAGHFSIENRAAVLEMELGCYIKIEHQDSDTLSGHSFLGFTFDYDEELGGIVPRFNSMRIIAGALKPKNLNPKTSCDRLANLAYLSCFCRPIHGADVYDMLRHLYIVAHNRLPQATDYFPTREEVWGMWLSGESRQLIPNPCVFDFYREEFGWD